MILLSYRFKMIVPFGDGEYFTLYELTLQKSYLFGLFKKEFKKDHSVSMFSDIKTYENHWDKLIVNKIQVHG